MKQVYSSNDACIHAFAQQKYDYGRTSNGNVYFEGKTLYSYGRHFILAEFITDNLVMINDQRYSNSTSKHQGIVRQALRQYQQLYVSSHDIGNVVKTLEHLKDKLLKARKPEIYLNEATTLIERHIHSQQLYPTVKNQTDYIERLVELREFYDTISVDLAEGIRERKEYEAQLRRMNADKFKEAFYNFEPFDKFKNAAGLGYDLLRRNGDLIETSQHVKVRIDEAKFLFNALKRGVDIVGQVIGGFTIRATSDKQVLIGCHNLKMEEIERVLQ